MRRKYWIVVSLAAGILFPTDGTGQEGSLVVGSELEDYVRFLQLDGKAALTPLVVRPLPQRNVLRELAVDPNHLWVEQYPLASKAASSAIEFSAIEPEVRVVESSPILVETP